ncbi:nonstructural protein [Capybara microvirus Cap3_SP_444]|nr:nonstructural protein [Capybara microvirus Cap3_SP_444]
MIKYVTAIRDKLANRFDHFTIESSIDIGVRSLRAALKVNPESVLSICSSDFEYFVIATIDDESGVTTPKTEFICSVDSLIIKEKSNG